MLRKNHGFTLVELIIVIVVIGILAAIVTSIWIGVLSSTRDHAREQDTRNWASTFDLYSSRFGSYPALPTSDTPVGDVTLCLGTFVTTGGVVTNSKCGQYKSAVVTQYIPAGSSATMLANMARLSSGNKAPVDSGQVINNMLVGPLVYLKQSTIASTVTVTAQFIDFFEGNCPSGFTNINSSLPSSIASVRSGTAANVCALTKTFVYTT